MSLDKVSTARRVLFSSGVVLLIWSFFPWNGFSLGFGLVNASVSWSAWHGWGTAMGIVLILLLAWEAVLFLQVVSPDAIKLPELPVKPMLITAALGVLTVLFGVLRVFEYAAKKWEIWIALLLIIALAAGVFLRFQDEGGAASVK
jgi:Na+/H+ antiporter NhaC